ncbi:MAG: hypothetical protein ACRC1D_07040 [Culicoidibacterales bacterium]
MAALTDLENEFIQMANELFEEFIPVSNAIYKSIAADTPSNNLTPWDVTFGTATDYNVKIVSVPSEIESRRYSQYRPGMEIPMGAVKVLMRNEGFEPKIKDFIKQNDKLWKVQSIDKVSPFGNDILYILTIGI